MLSMELWKGTLQQNASLRNVIACSGTELKVVRVPNSEVVRVTSSEVVRAAGAYCGWRLLPPSQLFFGNFITKSTSKPCNDFTECTQARGCSHKGNWVSDTKFLHISGFAIIGEMVGVKRFQEETPEAAFRGERKGASGVYL